MQDTSKTRLGAGGGAVTAAVQRARWKDPGLCVADPCIACARSTLSRSSILEDVLYSELYVEKAGGVIQSTGFKYMKNRRV